MSTSSDWEKAHQQIEEAKNITQRLTALLDDPHPGLFSWNTSYHDGLKRLCELSGYSITANTENDNG